MRFQSLVLLLGVASVSAQDVCDECIETAAEMQALWSNATSVEEILESLESQCAEKFTRQPGKKKVCDEFMQVLVQVPPGLFAGLETLAWDIPRGICLTIGQCSAPCCSEQAVPEQLHLSLPGMGDGSRMGVSWVTLAGTSSTVQYQLPDGSVLEQSGTVSTYPDEHPSQNKTLWPDSQGSWVGTIHRAVMVGLVANTAYSYRVSGNYNNNGGDTDGAIWSDWVPFKTFPSAASFQESSDKGGDEFDGDETSSLTFAVIGDMGYGNKSDDTVANLVQLVEAGQLDGVVHTGDVSYADGYMPHWDTFMNKVQPIASRVPYMVVAGNHEIWYNFSAFKHRFMMPGVGPLGGAETTGSGDGMFFEWGVPGLIHFAACDSETDLDTASFAHPFSDQVDWMNQTLAAANTPEARSSEPWSIAHFHRPLYCSNDGECDKPVDDTSGMASILREQGEELFTEHGVDLVMSGHIHSYERTLPMERGVATSSDYAGPGLSPVYIVQGSSGNRENNPGFPTDLPAWSAGHSSTIGFGLLKVTRSALDFKYFTAHPEAEGGAELLDSFTMTK